ncbi:LptF/LptG family permease [Thermosynechococcaceae cyanobacterium BACA0444]|uniref:LptF/LptG family permease n=1 Tax=Pseudocalidococcus azoricus BACA0444 TaxID=2918990 RepID=A0AAE4FU39_9CYAN|nr:LptF/LptG family permease [Pseudocalidococcus azoricus]MDS3861414.1 LptF/LptG family permease [Pseudocalidococcus azoricus BACA0444]
MAVAPTRPWLPISLPVLDRYLLLEMIAPFIWGLGIFTIIAAVIGTVFELIRRVLDSGLGVAEAGQVFLLRLPSFIVLGIPMAILFGTLMAYSRLSRRSEIIACKSVGIGARRLVVPALLAGLVAMTSTWALNEYVVPASSYQAYLRLKAGIDQPVTPFQERNIFYREFAQRYLQQIFFAQEFDGQVMQGVTILNFGQGLLSEIIAAESAEWFEPERAWKLSNGTRYLLDGNQAYQEVVPFTHQAFTYRRTPLELAQEIRTPEFMSSGEVKDFLGILLQSGDQKRIRTWRVQLQEKRSLPWVCLLLALIGSVLGINSPRSNNAWAFGLSVAVIFSYYLVSFVTISFGQGGILSPFVASWSPKIGLGLIGILLLIQAQRR